MSKEAILEELEALGTERTKKVYMQQGAKEPLFGVATGAMKPIAKRYRNNQSIAEELYLTGNYDAMYLAGMIADPKTMTEVDFDRWMEQAYFYMISDYIVAVTLAETEIAEAVSDKWIASGKDLYMSAGYNCYCWMLGNRKDEEFDREHINSLLDMVQEMILELSDRVKYAMINFVTTVGISYLPLHERAVEVAEAIGVVELSKGTARGKVPVAIEQIKKAVDKGQLGFKRKNVRC